MRVGETAIDCFMLSVGLTYSLDNIESVLGITILVLQLIWLLSKLIIKIVIAVKNKKIPYISESEIENTINTISDIKDKLDRENNDGTK